MVIRAFFLKPAEAKLLVSKEPKYGDVVKPFIIGEDMLGKKDAKPSRYVIDFSGKDLLEAQRYPDVFHRIQSVVLPQRQKAADKELKKNHEALAANPKAKVNWHHRNFLKHWWRMSYDREDMIAAIRPLNRYIGCSRTTLRPVFEFISSEINPNDAIQVFPFDDDYSFGIMQSTPHWSWFVNRCSTLTERFRYTSNTVWDSFPWPQTPTLASIKDVAEAGRNLRKVRRNLMVKHNLSFRDLYRGIELPGEHPLKIAVENLDVAVRKAYGMKKAADDLTFIFDLNQAVAAKEAAGETITGPGLPAYINDREGFISDDAIMP